ncbi:ATP-binding protein [Cerasicoccus maritimus]|uniref:ATP-binding protein n=1 Tax=Cerasicoccus maritimus TaxID=490089 RepID=UPI0028528047|nr:ATP-binding protein [Cerasicoccus maritimus]
MALCSALLILGIISGLALTLRFTMKGLLIDSLDEKMHSQLDFYWPTRDTLSSDPYGIGDFHMPPMPPLENGAALVAYDEGGLLLMQRGNVGALNSDRLWEAAQDLPPAQAGGFHYFSYPKGTNEWRLAVSRENGVTFAWVVSQANVVLALAKLDRAFLVLLPFALITAGIGGWEIGRRTLRPVSVLAERMHEIDAAGLDKRLDERGATSEIRVLILNHNRMLDRLERQFHQASRFSADAAHELNTPLTVMQSEVEAHLRTVENSPADLRLCESLLSEIMRLKAMSQKLLMLARSDNGQMPIDRKSIDLSALVSDLWEDIPLINPELSYTAHMAPDVQVLADADMLRLLVQNLLVNAVRYNRPGGWVRVTLTANAAEAELTVANASSPIPPEQAERLFDRFYRVDASRTSASGGSGLGLSLAREIADAHHAELKLCRNDGGVAAFRLKLACDSGQAEARVRPASRILVG